METTRFQAIPGHAPSTAKLIERLKAGQIGNELTDKELSDIAGIPVGVNKPGYAHLTSAIRYCIKNHKVWWERIRSAGLIRCLNHAERVRSGESSTKKIRRAGRRTMTKMAAVKADELGDADKTKYLSTIAFAGVVANLNDRRLSVIVTHAKAGTMEEAINAQRKFLSSIGT